MTHNFQKKIAFLSVIFVFFMLFLSLNYQIWGGTYSENSIESAVVKMKAELSEAGGMDNHSVNLTECFNACLLPVLLIIPLIIAYEILKFPVCHEINPITLHSMGIRLNI